MFDSTDPKEPNVFIFPKKPGHLFLTVTYTLLFPDLDYRGKAKLFKEKAAFVQSRLSKN